MGASFTSTRSIAIDGMVRMYLATMSMSEARSTSDLAPLRFLSANTFCTASSLQASQPIPHTVSVG